ncbi:hypothetical protein WA026_014358 [Henosepilachna vigintioctopunctata]|uniref:C2H2-type domain-containing protein n=1 Tax=Henosepilachna vigintioctopunctata TaxID=420089 RepID=A0AAW1ULV8_9CUCU
MTPTPEISNNCCTPIVSQKNQFLSKWNLIFTKNNGAAWISFKPQLGFHVYPCYACRDMFASKVTFQDHINRRAIMIKFDCKECNQSLTFYNRCSFLLHARNHFSLAEGKIDLNNIDIFSLPFGMMGFLPHPGIIKLFDVEEDTVDESCYINAQFYSPDTSERGKRIITLKPNDLLLVCSTANNLGTIQLTLKQISNNIPFCQFITVDCQKKLRQNCLFTDSCDTIKEEIPDSVDNPELNTVSPVASQMQMPVISKIESLSCKDPMTTIPECPECKQTQRCSMKMHFIGNNLPFNEDLKCFVCKYVASTQCSFSAHQRIHANVAPFVCPECGKKFESREYLINHLDDVCFHLAKQVRIRCPGKRCGKLFASPATFTAHFAQHIHTWFQCSICKECFDSMTAYSDHAIMHKSLCFSDKVYKCLGCKSEDSIIYQDNVHQHIEYHIADRSRCMYVFICKFCRNYFRSTVTYATHLLKCQKMQAMRKQGFSFTLDSCVQCHNRIIFYENENSAACSKCRYLNFMCINKVPQTAKKSIEKVEKNQNSEANTCILCKELIPKNLATDHSLTCVYRNPKILVKRLNDNSISKNTPNSSDTSLDSLMEAENADVHQNTSLFENDVQQKSSDALEIDDSIKTRTKSLSPKSLDGLKRKRKRAAFVYRGKKTMLCSPQEDINDLQADEATPFNGTYYCKLCDFQESDRENFHLHIVTHRDVSTAYQCMECGECFVVKPSLIKHLMHYHKIEDANAYLEVNNCYDRTAVEELKEIMKLAPGESRGPVDENQCRVCLQRFSDAQKLKKHFRIHGMAFLMKNSRE